jgi:hypothetical protein
MALESAQRPVEILRGQVELALALPDTHSAAEENGRTVPVARTALHVDPRVATRPAAVQDLAQRQPQTVVRGRRLSGRLGLAGVADGRRGTPAGNTRPGSRRTRPAL